VPINQKQLPNDAATLRRMVLDLIAQLDAEQARRIKTENLLRQLLAARGGKRSEQITEEQLALFEAESEGSGRECGRFVEGHRQRSRRQRSARIGRQQHGAKPRGRSPLPAHLKRERIVHDLAETKKHCAACDQEMRAFGEETSERYEYVPAQLIVTEDVCKSTPASAP
jgi:hypothetical protein